MRLVRVAKLVNFNSSLMESKTYVLGHIVYSPDQPPATDMLPLRARTYLSVSLYFSAFRNEVWDVPEAAGVYLPRSFDRMRAEGQCEALNLAALTVLVMI